MLKGQIMMVVVVIVVVVLGALEEPQFLHI